MRLRLALALTVLLGGCGSPDGPQPGQRFFNSVRDGRSVCPLGWSDTTATGDANVVGVSGSCSGAAVQAQFSPTPSPGGSAPCFRLDGPTGVESCITSGVDAHGVPYARPSGSVSLSSLATGFWVVGRCTCITHAPDNPASQLTFEFSLPLAVR